MTKIKKVYLPKWAGYVTIPFILAIWGAISYGTFFEAQPEEKLPFFLWVVLSLIFLGTIIAILLQVAQKIPTYIIKEEDKE